VIAIKKGLEQKFYDPEAFVVAIMNVLTPDQQRAVLQTVGKIGTPCLVMEETSIIRPSGNGPKGL
jgi:hypothetical protein